MRIGGCLGSIGAESWVQTNWPQGPPPEPEMKVSHLDKQLHRLTATGPRCDAEALVEHALLRVGRGAADTVSVEGVMQAYRRRGLGVASLSEIHDLAVEDIDQVAGRLCFKYQAMAIGEGLGVGFAGLPPSVVDIPALIGLSMRALAEIAAYYGYDVSQTWEQKFALMVLVLAAGPHDTGAQIDYALGCSGPGTDHAPLSARLRRQVTETLVGALMLETNDEWAVARRYMSLETLARVTDNPNVRLPAVAA